MLECKMGKMNDKQTRSVLLQGYLAGSNFGDILVAHLFYAHCKALPFREVDFLQFRYYGIGDFCRKELGYAERKSFWECLRHDAFILISGGYLWDHRTYMTARQRFFWFFFFPLIYQLMGKPVYVLGGGGGVVLTPWLRKAMVHVLNKAKVVYVRDAATKDIFTGYGVGEHMKVTADTALAITPAMLPQFEKKAELEARAGGRKKMFFHVFEGNPQNRLLCKNVMPAILEFLKSHKEYMLIISGDNTKVYQPKIQDSMNTMRQQFIEEGIDVYDYTYHDCWQLCALLNEVDCIVTPKLHVGVVGVALGKSVIAFPVHPEKTDHFYQMIGHSERCCNMAKLEPSRAKEMIDQFHNVPVVISEELREKAKQNLSVIDSLVN